MNGWLLRGGLRETAPIRTFWTFLDVVGRRRRRRGFPSGTVSRFSGGTVHRCAMPFSAAATSIPDRRSFPALKIDQSFLPVFRLRCGCLCTTVLRDILLIANVCESILETNVDKISPSRKPVPWHFEEGTAKTMMPSEGCLLDRAGTRGGAESGDWTKTRLPEAPGIHVGQRVETGGRNAAGWCSRS